MRRIARERFRQQPQQKRIPQRTKPSKHDINEPSSNKGCVLEESQRHSEPLPEGRQSCRRSCGSYFARWGIDKKMSSNKKTSRFPA
jgi:hypothetical protein